MTKTELENAGLETDGMAESVSQLQAKLKALTHGKVDIMIDANTFKSSTQVLREMAGAWQDMTDIERSAALELMGGKRQANILASIIKNFDTVEQVITTSQNSTGSALAENAKYLDSIQGKLDQLSNSTQTMWMHFMNSEVVKFLISVAIELVKIVDNVGLLQTAFAGVLGYLSIFSKQKSNFDFASMLGIHKLDSNFIKGFEIFGKEGATGFVGNIINQINQAIKDAEKIEFNLADKIVVDDAGISQVSQDIRDGIDVDPSAIDDEIAYIEDKLMGLRDRANSSKIPMGDIDVDTSAIDDEIAYIEDKVRGIYDSAHIYDPANPVKIQIDDIDVDTSDLDAQLRSIVYERRGFLTTAEDDYTRQLDDQLSKVFDKRKSILDTAREKLETRLSELQVKKQELLDAPATQSSEPVTTSIQQEIDELETRLSELQAKKQELLDMSTAPSSEPAVTSIKQETQAYQSMLDVLGQIKNKKLNMGNEQEAAHKLDLITEAAGKGQEALAQHMAALGDEDIALKAYVASVDDGNYSLSGFDQFIQAHNAKLQQSTVAAKAAAAGHAILNAALSMGISLLAGWAIGLVIEGLDNLYESAEETAEKVKELTDTYEKAKKSFSDNLETLTKSSDTNKYATLKDEFIELADGVDKYGNNIGLTSSQYERYKAICDQIVGINPKIAEGYDNNTRAIGKNVDILSQLIELQKIQTRQNAQEYLKDDNLQEIAKKKANDFEKAQETYDSAWHFQGVKDRQAARALAETILTEEDYQTEYGKTPEEIAQHILEKLGYDQDYIDNILNQFETGEYIIYDLFIDHISEIAQNDVKFTNIDNGTNLIKDYLDSIDYEYAGLEKETAKLKEAKDGLINALLQVPIGSEDYDELNDGTQKFITEWIKNGEQFKIPEGASKEDIKNLLTSSIENISAMISELANSKPIDINGKLLTAQDVIDQIYNLDPSTVSWDQYKSQITTLVNGLYESIGGEGNKFGVETKDLEIAFGLKVTETDDAVKSATEQIANLLNTDAAIINDKIKGFTAAEIQAFVSFNWGEMGVDKIPDWQAVLDMIRSKMPDSTQTVQTYSQISEMVSKYNDTVAQSAEIVSDNTKVTREYKDALIEAGFTTEELIKCFGEENGLVVKNAQALRDLTKAKKDEIATTIRLTRAQIELQYNDVIQSISNQMALADADMAVTDSLFEQASALRAAINQYQLLESSLLGATNAFTQFSKAKETDSQNTYGSTLVEMAQTMYDAIYKTGEVGSEAFWAAVKATVPNDIYMGLAPGQQQIQAISNYLQDNLFSGLTFSGDSFSIDYNSIESFIKKAQSKGLFSGTDTTVFGLSSAFTDSLADGENGLKKFAEQLGVTEEYVYAIFSEMDKYNANGFGLSMLFQLDSSTTSQMTILNTQLEQAYATRKRLIEQGADLSANTVEISRIQSQQAEIKTQATDNTTKYLTATNALKDPTKQVKDVLSQELILEIGLSGEQTVESAFQKISDWLLQMEEPTVLDLQISQESIQNSMREIEQTYGKEDLETELKIRSGIIEGDRNTSISDEALNQYAELLNLDQYVDDALSANLTTTESLLSQIAKNTGIMAGTEDTSGTTTTDTTQSGTTSTVNLKVDQEKPKVNIDAYAKEVYEQYQEAIDRMNELGIGPSDTIFGNIDTNNRQVLEWTTENLAKYKDALQSWFKDDNGISIPWEQIVGDLSGSISTVLGMSSEYDGVEIAFSPMLQTENGAVLLNADTVNKYIYGLIDQANPDGWTKEELLALDAKGLEIDGQKIKGLLADIGDTAKQTGEAMHWTGTDGTYTEAYQLVEVAAAQAGVTVTKWIDMVRMAMLGVEDTTNNATGSMTASFYKVKQAGIETYSTLQSQIASYNDIVSQTSEILTNGTKVTEEYKNSLVALGVDTTELNACFDVGTSLILKDIDALNKLVDAAKKNTANNVRLAKSQAQLRYYELCEEMRAVIGTSDQLRASQVANINRLYQEMGTVQGTIAQYSFLESQLLGVANAYERIAAAQQMDSTMDYGSKTTELVNILAGAFKTGKLGTEAAKVAFKGLIPDSILTEIDPDKQMDQAYKYFTEGPLSKLFKIEYGKDGSVSSVEMPLENIKSYIEELTKEGKVFTGTWDAFELNPNIKSMDDFAQALGVTKEVALGLLTTLEQYDISWLGGDMETLIDQLMGDNLEYSIQKSTAKTAQLLKEKAQILGKDPSKRSDDEKKRLQEINAELEAQGKIMEENRASAVTMWQDFSSGEDAVKTLSSLEQKAKLSKDQFDQIFGNISEDTREKFGLTWNENTSVADYLEKVRDMQLALGQPTELVLEIAKSDAEEQIKGILGVDSLDDPITLQAQFKFNTATGEYEYQGDRTLTKEQLQKLTEAYGEWVKLNDLLNLPNMEDYAKRSAEAAERTADATEIIAGQKTEDGTDNPSDGTNPGGETPPPENPGSNPPPENPGSNPPPENPGSNPDSGTGDDVDVISSASSKRVSTDLADAASAIGDSISTFVTGTITKAATFISETFDLAKNNGSNSGDTVTPEPQQTPPPPQQTPPPPQQTPPPPSTQSQFGGGQGGGEGAGRSFEGIDNDYSWMTNDQFKNYIQTTDGWFEKYVYSPMGSINLTEQQKGIVDTLMPEDLKEQFNQDLMVEPQTMTADAQQVIVNGTVEQTGNEPPKPQPSTETPAQPEQPEAQGTGIDVDETDVTSDLGQAIELANEFGEAMDGAKQSASQLWVGCTPTESALAALGLIQNTATELSQEEAAEFGIEIDEGQVITVQEAIDQLLAKKEELNNTAVIRAVFECQGIDMEIQRLKELLGSDTDLEVQAEIQGISKEELQADIEAQIQELQTEKVLTMAGAFNIELSPDDVTEVTKKLAEIEATKFTEKNVSVKMSGVDYAIEKITKLNQEIDKINTDIQIDVAVNDKPNSGGDGESGTIAVNGTAHAKGTAFKTGSWGAPRTETALVGELGPELLVRGNRWTTVGENGAEFTDVRRGDIIFNHQQTRSLLENGYVTGRGKAFAEGTAYAGINTWTTQANFSNTNSASKKLSQAADDLSSAADDLSEDFEEIFDWIEVRIEEITETINLLGAQFENAIGSINQNAIIDDQINMNKQLYDNLIAGANEYYKFAAELLKKVPKEYRNAAQNGQIAIEYFKDKVGQQALEAIQNYREWVQKGADFTQQAEETLTEISNLAKQAIDNIASDYENKKSFSTIRIDQYEAYNSLLETGAGAESARVYEEIIKENNKNIATLQEQRNKMQAELNKQVEAGNIKKYSQNWYDAINDIAAVDTEIIELTTDTENYQDTINELHWDHFDNLISRLEAISDEADNLIDILSAKDLVDKDTAEWTDEGITSLGLYAQKLEVAEMQAEKYAKEIRYLNDNWKALGYTEQEYVEKLEDLKNGQYDAIKAYNQTKDAIVDLNKERVDAIKDGIQKEIDAYSELINKKKEELNSEKDLYDFQKGVADQQKNIAEIQRKLIALSSDNSASARAERARLQAELAEAQADLEDTYYDRSVTKQQEALDKELEDFQSAKDDEMEALDEYLENTEQVVADSLATIQANTDTVYQTLTEMGQEYSLSIAEALTNPWQDGEAAIQSYSEKFGLSMSSTVEELQKVAVEYKKVMDQIEEYGDRVIDKVNNNIETYQGAEEKVSPKVEPKPTQQTNAIKVGSKVNAGKAQIYSYAGAPTGKKQYYSKDPVYKVLAVKGNWVQVRYHKNKKGVTGWFRKGDVRALASGTTKLDKSGIVNIDELGEELVLGAKNGRLSYLEKGSSVIPADITSNLMSWGELDPQSMLDRSRPVINAPHITNNNIEINMNFADVVRIDTVTNDTIPDLTKAIEKQMDKYMKNVNSAIRKYAR